MLYLDAPFRYDREAVRYYASQLKQQLIPFLETGTGRKLDIDRFREVITESNKAYEHLVDVHDTYKVLPAPHNGFLRLVPFFIYISGAGNPGTTRTLRLLSEDAARRVKEGRTQDIPVLFVELDYSDDRVLSKELLRSQVEDFFTTVME